MYCTYMLTLASLKVYLRNTQAVFFTLFFPMLILFIFGVMNVDGTAKLDVGVVTHAPDTQTQKFIEQIGAIDTFKIHSGTLEAELAELHNGNRAAVLNIPDHLVVPGPGGTPILKAFTSSALPVNAQDRPGNSGPHRQPLVAGCGPRRASFCDRAHDAADQAVSLL